MESVFGGEGYGGADAAPAYLPWLETVAPRDMAAGEPVGWADGEGEDRDAAGERASIGFGRSGSIAEYAASRERTPEGGVARQTSREFAGLLHDARNMVTAMELYCDLLEEPGVLTRPYRRYAGELRLVSAASRRLLDKLAKLASAGRREAQEAASSGGAAAQDEAQAGPRLVYSAPSTLARPARMQAFAMGEPVESLAEELRANRNLLGALAGSAITVGLSIRGGDRPLAMSREDLTRILVNLTRNAAEAMPAGGHLQIDLEERPFDKGTGGLTLTFSDTGAGIPPAALETIFSPGYTTHVDLGAEEEAHPEQWPAQHRGLGLAIVRSIAAAAGGSVWAANHRDSAGAIRGAVFTLEFPLAAPA